jgi:NDP-sugar pyrophosphorylase family protein
MTMAEKEQTANNYKVFIPCAGVGARLGEFTENVNKALVSIANKPAISHIIEKFNKETEIVIALGYKGDYIKQFLELAYPDRNFQFVEIDKYQGEGSGLGYTLNKCRKYLQSEFIFISNDTIITDEIPSLQKMNFNNWVGYSDVKGGSKYRSLQINKEGIVKYLYEKSESVDSPAYIGVCGIKDYRTFWSHIDKNSIITGESYAIQQMLLEGIKFDSIKFNWYDAGDKDILNSVKEKFKKDGDPNILEKPNESIWFVEDRVIKFSIDQKFISNRVKRCSLLDPYIPQLLDQRDNMYSYKKVNGVVFSEAINVENFKFLLDWLTVFHQKPLLDVDEESFKSNCFKFYKDKTYSRIEEYFSRFNNIDSDREIINGIKTPSIKSLLDQLDWDYISSGTPVRFHGDLHFENILVAEKNDTNTPPLTLLDWRQDFCGDLNFGDIYYDYAKLMHGLIISHDLINDNLYTFNRSSNEIKYDFLRKNVNIDCVSIFEEYIKKQGYDENKVNLMTSLIFLNIAGLHHYPYCHLLFYLGKSSLYRLLSKSCK